jgi:ribonuclease G
MKYIVRKNEDRILSFLLDDTGHAVEIHADRPVDGPVLGDVCIGRVQKVAKDIQAVFVEIGPGMTGYLPMESLVCPIFTRKGPSSLIQQGDELVVQICREAFGDKGVSLTTKLEFSGRLVILTAGGAGIGISRKIPEEKRQELKDRIMDSEGFGQLTDRVGQCGIIVRTNAAAASREEILEELALLEARLINIRLTAPYRPAFTVLYKMPSAWLRRLDSLNEASTDTVLTDDQELFSLMKQYLCGSGGEKKGQGAGSLKERIRLYEDRLLPMHKLYSLDRELERALSKYVNMKSGADLVIETTEALHVIDVNSGRSKAGKLEKEEQTLKVNLEAARESARQIRLRNLSGIILIDFINLSREEDSEKVTEALREAVAKDPIHTQVFGLTRLGLMELTRRKVELPLEKQLED